MNMTSDYRDPLIDLLNSDPNSPNNLSLHDDIQVINRGNNNPNATNDHMSYSPQQPLTPLLTQQNLYTTNGSSSNAFDLNHNHPISPEHHQLEQLHQPQPQVSSPPRKKRNTRSQTRAHYQQQQQQQQQQQDEQNEHQSSIQPEIIETSNSIFRGDGGSDSGASEYFQPTPISPATQQQQQRLIGQDLQIMNSKYSNPIANFEQHLPPLQPLSESVIPHGISFQPLILPNDPRHSLTAGSSTENNGQQQQQQQQQNHQSQEQSISAQGNTSSGATGLRKRKENVGPKTRPAFVMKIWSMVNDPVNSEYIRWNDDGKTFQVFQREEFMKIILPKYFKHNNFASFVRQLNMYGWHKVQDISNGTLNQSYDKNGQDEIWQFENPNFIRDREDLLDKIIRNKSTSTHDDVGGGNSGVSFNNLNNAANLSLILQELETIKMNQYAISEDLRRVRLDNKMLWQENYLNRERNQVQGRTLDKILKFLSVIYGNNANQLLNGSTFNIPNANLNANAKNSVAHYKPPTSPFIPRSKSQPPSDDYFQQQLLESDLASSSNNFNENINGASDTTTNNMVNNEFDNHAVYRPRLMLTNKAHTKRPSIPRPKSTPEGSIEEIIRSYSNDKLSESNAHNMVQQLMNNHNNNNNNNTNTNNNLDPHLMLSPRNSFLQELNLPDTPKNYDELDKNINSQGQSIQQVQDWIEKLAEEQRANSGNNTRSIDGNNNSNHDHDDEFDVNEFLREAATPGSVVNSPVVITPGSTNANNSNGSSSTSINAGSNATSNSNGNNNKKRSIQEVNDGNGI